MLRLLLTPISYLAGKIVVNRQVIQAALHHGPVKSLDVLVTNGREISLVAKTMEKKANFKAVKFDLLWWLGISHKTPPIFKIRYLSKSYLAMIRKAKTFSEEVAFMLKTTKTKG